MRIKPVKPASGLAIRNAFQIAAIKMTGEVRYYSVHEETYGEKRFDFSGGTKEPVVTHSGGDSAFFTNDKGKRVRLWLVHPEDETLYTEFVILAAGIPRELESYHLSAFKKAAHFRAACLASTNFNESRRASREYFRRQFPIPFSWTTVPSSR